MLCACGKMVHPCYENGGVCEDCIAEHSEKFHLPGCRAVYGGGSAREDDCRDNQTIIRSSKADCRGHRRRDIAVVASHLMFCASMRDAEHSIAQLHRNRPEYFSRAQQRRAQSPKAH